MAEIEIATRVADALQEYAEQPLRIDDLRTGALTRARSIRRKRRVLATTATAGLVAVLTAGAVGLPRAFTGGHGGGGYRPPVAAGAPSSPSAPATRGPTTLPPVPDAPTAAENPAAVGTDPAVLHFDLDLVAAHVTEATWSAGGGYEGVSTIVVDTKPYLEILVGPDADQLERVKSVPGVMSRDSQGNTVPHPVLAGPDPTTVDGRPATLEKISGALPGGTHHEGLLGTRSAMPGDSYSWILRFEPRDGLHALVQVFQEQPSVALTLAGALRFDRAQRCAVPIHLNAIPAGATWTRCIATVRRAGTGTAWVNSQLSLTLAGGKPANVWVEEPRKRAQHDLNQYVANLTVAGHRAQWRTADPKGLWILNFGRIGEVFVTGASKADSVSLVAGLTLAPDLNDPAGWPRRAVG